MNQPMLKNLTDNELINSVLADSCNPVAEELANRLLRYLSTNDKEINKLKVDLTKTITEFTRIVDNA